MQPSSLSRIFNYQRLTDNKMKRKEKGNLGESLARDFLKRKGYRILETNYRCQFGEIDIIACFQDYLVFIEVRTKSSLNYGTPEESITATKIQHLERAVANYQQNHLNLPTLWRADLVAVELDGRNQLKRIEHIENAFER